MALSGKTFLILVAAGLLGLSSPSVWADEQAERLQALEKRLEQSVQLIERLSARLAELEQLGRSGARPAVVAPAAMVVPASSQALASLEQTVAQLSEGLGRRGADSGLALHGFADVGAAWSSGKDPVKLRGFNAGTLDLYLTPQFGDRTKALVEIAIEYGEDGALAVDMERLQLGYTVSDGLTLWLGRFHTPFGQYNTAFHHGANLQTAIFRPRFIDFEDKGGIIPAHSVGLWATGKTALAGGMLTYDGFIANGPRIADRTLDFMAFSDNGGNKMAGFNLGYQAGGALNGLSLGLHGFGSTVQVQNTAGALLSNTRLRMAGAYLGYDEHDWEVIAETYHFANQDLGSGTRHASRAGFVQAGRTFGLLTPFVRLEKVSLDPRDNFFRSQASGRSYRRSAFGLRYALDAKASFKVELGSTVESAADQIDEAGASLPFASRSYRRGAVQYSVAF